MSDQKTGLALLREPFADNQIGQLPKPKSKDASKGYCKECGGYHGLPAVHLDYVGHAAVTNRLLDADPAWNWEPVAWTDEGTPRLTPTGGLWIKLTVCGVTRLGYGDAQGKTGNDAMKETIGDALRNAAMRFGVALALWHKGELNAITTGDGPGQDVPPPSPWTDELLTAAGAAAEAGTKAYGAWWKAQTPEARSVLIQTPDHASFKEVANKADHRAADLAAAQEAETA
jgi:hypothetical protein